MSLDPKPLKKSKIIIVFCLWKGLHEALSRESQDILNSYSYNTDSPLCFREVSEDTLWEERRRGLDCKALGEGCGGVIRCCGAAVCYWEDGVHLIKVRIRKVY